MFDKVKELLIEELQVDAEKIVESAELANDLGVNSLDLADMILLCEERFGVEISDDDIHKFITVGDIVKYLEENAK